MLWRSVVLAGIVHVKVTLSPFRCARRSEGGFGNSSDGGVGGPIEAHPASAASAATATSTCPFKSFMRRNNRLHHEGLANVITGKRSWPVPNRESIPRRQSKLPVRQSKPFLQFLRDKESILARQHQSNPAPRLLFRRLHRSRRRMPRHRPRIAQIKIDITM